MSLSAARSVPLALLLAAWHVSHVASSTAATSVATQNVSQGIPDHSSSTAGLHTENITPDATTSMQSFVPTTETTNLPFMTDNITITGSPQSSTRKNITLVSPTELELLCSLPLRSSMEMEKIEVVWKMGNTTIKEDTINRNETKTKWCTRYTVYVKNKDQMGDYTCIFKTKQEVNATFHLQVPEIHIKSENIITYVGYSVIMTCFVGNDTVHYNSSFWTWYKINGSEKVAINSSIMPKKYDITPKHGSISKLKISELSEDDSGFYYCEARYPPGESNGKVSLKVLTYMAPLKPFLAIAAEVIILVAFIFIYEVCSKRKDVHAEPEKEFDQTETLKSEDSNGVENSTTRHRKV
ncbi:embigin [Varanus komodoensis]|uniref:Embigin n=1 Tax=Varanus komodoensis TaxID=61221 RepID=A0A8D2ISL7_VARKO|nr:embigin [Varanus komodoensis]